MKNILLLLALFSYKSLAQETTKNTPVPAKTPTIETPPSVTQHQISIKGKTIAYKATSGTMLMKDEDGKSKASIFYTAYTKNELSDASVSKRPITYVFNGGPGSASVWLHLGALGPKRVLMSDKGDALPPPYTLVENEYAWLDFTDLVFIDPVLTGYSRPAEGVDKKEFHGYEEDIKSIGDFIRLHISRSNRWASPKYLAGESYGTTRAAGLSGYLQDKYGLYLNGLVLISSILNFQTARFEKGNDLPYALFLPTYAAIAWYHGKVKSYPELPALLKDVEQFVVNDYNVALLKGDQMSAEEKNKIVQKLSLFTGLSKEYIESSNYRIHIARFCKELLRDENKTVGRLDGRFTGTEYDSAGENIEFDPSLNGTISGPYSTLINDYLRRELKVENDLPYEVLTGRVQPWSYKNVENQYLHVGETLRSAMSKNPYLKVLVCNGYYDLATPYFATDYTFNHLFLDKKLQKNIQQTFYESGHMMYIHKKSLIKFRDDVEHFYTNIP